MKRAKMCLSSIKYRYFMLFACLTLSICATSCSGVDDFENNLPEESKQFSKAEVLQKFSKAELIGQALSRMPQTRVESEGVAMITIKDSVNIKVRATETMTIIWGDDSTSNVIADDKEHDYSHGYKGPYLSHAIYIIGSGQALRGLTVNNNELISLSIYSNENLETLNCVNNYLEELRLPNVCPVLQVLDVSNNELSAIDLACMPVLCHFYAENNQLIDINVSSNPDLSRLTLGKNKITAINLFDNPNLALLNLSSNPLKELDLSKNANLSSMDVSFTSITDLDLRNNPNLTTVFLEGLSLETINEHPICDTSFSMFPRLFVLNVASTPFTLLDLSKNTMLYSIDISGSKITELDLSGVRVHTLRATRSKLTSLRCTKADFVKLYELRIEYTPYEKDLTNIKVLGTALPNRVGVSPGHLYTYSLYIDEIAPVALNNNWLINQ